MTLDIDARKVYADGEGRETDTALDEAFDVGLFAAEPGTEGFDQEDVIVFERRPIHSGTQTLQFVAPREPSFGGVDPYNKRVDRNSEDNVSAIEGGQ